MIKGLDHLQLAMPAGGEAAARAFYTGLLGLREIEKPVPLQARGGCWFEAGSAQIHLGVEEPFAPARKAHPAFLVADLEAARTALEGAGVKLEEDSSGSQPHRVYLPDCFGNRLELIQDGAGFSQGKALVRARFGALAERYVASPTHAGGDDLARMLELAQPRGSERMLDVATGGGHTALHFAPHVSEVVATDLTPPMLAAAKDHVLKAGATNVSFETADAESLPFEAATFDLVTCRIAPHHFGDPARFVIEAARVLRPGGRLVVDDNMAPEDLELANFMNGFEKLRDPSHVAAHTLSSWCSWMVEAGLEIETAGPLEPKTYEFESWTSRQNLSPAEKQSLEQWILAAPDRCRDYFSVSTGADGRLLSLSARFGIIAARKPG